MHGKAKTLSQMDAAIARWKCPGDLTAVDTDVVVRLLTSVYGCDDSAIRSAFTKMLGLENVQIEDDQSVEAALALTTEGVEIADAIHLTSRPPDARFVTFDRQLIRLGHRAGVAKVSNVAADRS